MVFVDSKFSAKIFVDFFLKPVRRHYFLKNLPIIVGIVGGEK
jgi:hypothetical protein